MDMLMALALSIGILIAAWVKLGPMANLAVPAGIIAWGCFFAAGGKMQGLQKTVAATISGVFWVWLAMTLIGMMNMGDVAFIIIGIVAFILVMQSDRKSTRLNSSHLVISYAVFCLKKKKRHDHTQRNCNNYATHTQSRNTKSIITSLGTIEHT